MKINIYALSIILLLFLCGCPTDPYPDPRNIQHMSISDDYVVATFHTGYYKKKTTYLLQRIDNNVEILDSISTNWCGFLQHIYDIDGDYLYLVKNTDLVIYDISNSTFNLISETLLNAGYLGAVEALDNYAYISGGDGLIKTDISDKMNPVVIDHLKFAYSYFRDLILLENTAYMLDIEGLYIIDISNSTMGVISYTDFDVSGKAFGIFVFDNKAYVTCNYFESPSYETKLMIYDISNSDSPVLLCDYLDNNLHCGFREVAVSNNYAYIAGPLGLYIYDVSDPSAPSYTATYDTPHNCVHVRIKDNHAYVSASRFIYILDITNPTSPQEVTTFRNP
jgi:hypothetical protein